MNKYIILGPPGSGKSTQATTLAKAFGWVRISVGDIFRWNIQNHTKLGARIHRHIDSGLLVPDDIVEEVIEERLDQHDWNFGFVLDGYPASRTQAEFFLESYDVNGVIFLQVPDEILRKRLEGLRVCGLCGFDHSLIHDVPATESICELCGGNLVNRSSESPAAIQQRLEEFRSKTEPALELFRRKELVVAVDGTQTPEEIHHCIQAELGLATEASRQLAKEKRPV